MKKYPDTSKWGEKMADKRYGAIKQENIRPSDGENLPQSPADKQAKGYNNDVPDDWLRGYGTRRS